MRETDYVFVPDQILSVFFYTPKGSSENFLTFKSMHKLKLESVDLPAGAAGSFKEMRRVLWFVS